MAASLALSSAMFAFAADPAGTGTSGGTGGIEGIVKTDVYTAVLPTEATTAYDYIADPQGLIRKTNAVKYSGKTFGDGTIFFENTETGAANDYSNTSDTAKIVNQSSKNLSVKVTAKATAGSGDTAATLAASSTFAGTDKEVYLGIKDGSAEKPLTAAGVEMTAVLGAAPEDAYEYSYVSDGDTPGYKYAIKSNVDAFKFAEYSFQITGAANDKATDWAADTALPAIEVTWEVDLTDDAATVDTPEQKSAPSIANKTVIFSKATGAEITVNLGTGDLAAEGIKSVATIGGDGTAHNWAAADYSLDDTTLKLSKTAQYIAGVAVGQKRTVKVTFDDDASTVVELEVTVQD